MREILHRPAPAGGPGRGGGRRRPAGHAAAVSARGTELAAFPDEAGPRRLPCLGNLWALFDFLNPGEKRRLADDILAGDAEVNLTELSDEALMDLVRLDVTRAAL